MNSFANSNLLLAKENTAWLSIAKGVNLQSLSLDQILHVMSQINASVKSGLFNAQLTNQIFILCQQLKLTGHVLEQSHKSEMNRVFVSLRQACCRDNGQLGTPCRLKMMELVELRAMGWRPSLAHTQYYLNHPEYQNLFDVGPVSAPPFGAIPVNPFSNYVAPPPPLFVSGDLAAPQVMPQPPPASFYLIPAPGNWVRPLITPAAISSTVIPQLSSAEMDSLVRANKMHHPKFTLKLPQNKAPQLRDEFVIRNSDSGKIMGVKGRRVALVEELSHTVISFQKVDSRSKDRTLTITGSSQESLDYAKRLIEQTIRRNVSPIRADQEGLALEDEEDIGITIETTQDGSLKLSCADPQLLQAAQAALCDYLTRTSKVQSKLTPEERELRKERRKSMPLPANLSDGNCVTISISTSSVNNWRSTSNAVSTPNLAHFNGGDEVHEQYSRCEMLNLRSAALPLAEETAKLISDLEIKKECTEATP